MNLFELLFLALLVFGGVPRGLVVPFRQFLFELVGPRDGALQVDDLRGAGVVRGVGQVEVVECSSRPFGLSRPGPVQLIRLSPRSRVAKLPLRVEHLRGVPGHICHPEYSIDAAVYKKRLHGHKRSPRVVRIKRVLHNARSRSSFYDITPDGIRDRPRQHSRLRAHFRNSRGEVVLETGELFSLAKHKPAVPVAAKIVVRLRTNAALNQRISIDAQRLYPVLQHGVIFGTRLGCRIKSAGVAFPPLVERVYFRVNRANTRQPGRRIRVQRVTRQPGKPLGRFDLAIRKPSHTKLLGAGAEGASDRSHLDPVGRLTAFESGKRLPKRHLVRTTNPVRSLLCTLSDQGS